MLPQCVSWTDGPSNIASLMKQRERWHRVEIETVWRFKSMFLNPRYGIFAFLAFPYYLFYEVLGVFFEVTSIVFVALGWWWGVLDARTFVVFFILMVSTQILFSLLSILSFIRSQRLFPTAYVIYLMFLSLVEFLFYRWIISLAKMWGALNYNRGIKEYNQYERAKRAS